MKTAYLVGGFIALVLALLAWSRFAAVPAALPLITDPNALPGIQTGAAPWVAETASLRERLKDIALPALSFEGAALHTHQHLDIFVNGKPVAVSAGIGDAEALRFIAPVHTHDESGIIHVESNAVRDFTLGQFFDIWGVRFTTECIGGYCASATSTLAVYENGEKVAGDPRALTLKPHAELMVVYGSAKNAPSVISRYAFPPGY